MRKNATLTHLDISHNNFSLNDMIVIGDGLRENQSLLGIHTEGNNAYIDPIGFVRPKPNDKEVEL